MIDRSFPEVEYPTAVLTSRVAERMRDYDLEPLRGSPVHIWDNFLNKLKSQTTLTSREKVIGLINYHQIPGNFADVFRTLFYQDIDPSLYARLVKKLTREMAPELSIALLAQADIEITSSWAAFPNVLRVSAERPGGFSFLALIDSILDSGHPLEDLRSLSCGEPNSITTGQQRLLRSLSTDSRSETLFRKDSVALASYLLQGFESHEMATDLIDSLAARYLEAHPQWVTEVLSDKEPVGRFLRWFRGLGEVERRYFEGRRVISRILYEAHAIENVLNDLRQEGPERAEYWRKKLESCSFVVQKRQSGANAKVAVAFGVGDYVVVEFAPVGAAYLYSLSDFREKIEASGVWRNPELGQDYPGLTNPKMRGQIRHIGNWQDILNRLLRGISN